MNPSSSKYTIEDYRRACYKAFTRIAKSLRNRGITAYAVRDPKTNEVYLVLPIEKLLEFIRNHIRADIRPFIKWLFTEAEKWEGSKDKPVKVKEHQIWFYLDVRELERKGVVIAG